MSLLYILLSIAYILNCLFLIAVILLQKKRTSGMASMSGGTVNQETYWDKNKGRSLEGTLERYTKISGTIFFIFTIVMSIIV